MNIKTLKKVSTILMVGGLICTGMPQQTAKAAETSIVQASNPLIVEDRQEGQLAIIKSSIYSTGVLATASTSGDGVITGDGVRLRKSAKATATVLELMYAGELVQIINDDSAKWWKVKRCKTGTKGYVNTKYVIDLD